MKQLQTPNGNLIIGTLEIVPGCAKLSGFNDDLEPEYDGETKMWWDEQKFVTSYTAGGGYNARPDAKPSERIYLDEQGNEWNFNELTVIDK